MENNENHHFENLKNVFRILGKFQKETHKTQQSISKYFKKKNLPDSTIAELAEALNVDEKVIRKNILKTKLEKIIASIKKKK